MQSTTESVFGGSSTYFDGSNDRLNVEDTDWSFGYDDFTIDMWVWIENRIDMGLATTQTTVTVNDGWMFDLDLHGGSGSYGLRFVVDTNYVLRDTAGSGASYPTQTWMHVAVVRHDGTFTSYIDGITIASATETHFIDDTASVLRVGHRGTYSDWFHGYIDEVRIVKGAALWTEDFIPPQAPTP